MASSPTRRDVLRALGTGALTLPFAACAPLLGSKEPTPIRLSGTPSYANAPTRPAEVFPLDRDGQVNRAEIQQMAQAEMLEARPLQLPPRLPAGGVVGLVAPAGVLRSSDQVDEAVAALRSLGFQTKVGRRVLNRFGFLAGTDAARASDFMDMVTDPEVDAVVALRGGWGCARILPFLDYEAIAANPKPIVGYSDITALLLAIYAKTGLVTFHGPVGISTWEGLTSSAFVDTLVRGRTPVLGPETRSDRDRTETIRPGVAEGPVVGGNLSVIAALAGTGYLPSFDGHLVCFEEVGEDAYRVDRLLVQLELAGVMAKPAGVAFGQCSNCSSGGSSWSAEETIRQHLQVYSCPTLMGAPVGHVSPVPTLPIGLRARLDTDAGTLEYVGAAVA